MYTCQHVTDKQNWALVQANVEQIDDLPTVMLERCFSDYVWPVNTALDKYKKKQLASHSLPFIDYGQEWDDAVSSQRNAMCYRQSNESELTNAAAIAAETRCVFVPPSVQDVLNKRRELGIASGEDSGLTIPSFVPLLDCDLLQVVPGATVSVVPDQHAGYRTLAYLLFFDGQLGTVMRQLVTSYVILHAGEPWVASKHPNKSDDK